MVLISHTYVFSVAALVHLQRLSIGCDHRHLAESNVLSWNRLYRLVLFSNFERKIIRRILCWNGITIFKTDPYSVINDVSSINGLTAIASKRMSSLSNKMSSNAKTPFMADSWPKSPPVTTHFSLVMLYSLAISHTVCSYPSTHYLNRREVCTTLINL